MSATLMTPAESEDAANRRRDIPEADERIDELRVRIDRGTYGVDSERVATAIINRLRLIETVRRELADEADRSPEPKRGP